MLDRRTFLKGTAAVTGGLVAGLAPGGVVPGSAPRGVWAQQAGGGSVRVYVVVVDGLRPDEVDPVRTPQLAELAAAGTYYPQSRSQMIPETTPNHVSMLTGMRTGRHGMPGNAVPFVDSNVGFQPRYLQADSIFTLARRQAPDLLTASVTAKTYLVSVQTHDRTGDGDEDASSTNRVSTAIPVDESARDVETGAQALEVSRELDPDFLFLNLGDVDRAGHVDETGGLTGGEFAAFRTTVLQTADLQVRNLVNELKDSGRWERTVFMVTADHSMDWSRRDAVITLQPAFEGDALLAGEVEAAANGGACTYALRAPNEPRAAERLKRMRQIALGTEGIREALYTRPNPLDGGTAHTVGRLHPDWAMGPDRAGDLIVTVEAGWRIGHSSFDQEGNPIPGNHGHPETLPIPVIVAGGWAGLAPPRVVDPGRQLAVDERDAGQAENIDMATTAAWLLGLNPPPGGFDGRVLSEAFARRPAPRVEVANVVSLPVSQRLDGLNRFATAARLSQLAFGESAETVVIASGGDFPDALAATPLAIAEGAPLLLAERDALPPETAAEVARLGAERALVIGGEAALGPAVVAGLVAAGVPEGGIERIAGPDRYATAAEVAARVVAATPGVDADQRQAVLVAGDRRDGDAFPDVLAAGPFAGAAGRPILLSSPEGLPPTTVAALEELGITRVVIGGGTAVVPQRVEDELRARSILVERIWGADRWETGRLFAERHIREGGFVDDVYLASGANYPDALAAGAAVGALGGTLLLVPPDGLGTTGSRRFLHERSDAFVRVSLVGGVDALPAALAEEVDALLRARRSRPS
jgi:ectonucleotide pyrophosphatase/phosphodiesterase family member 5